MSGERWLPYDVEVGGVHCLKLRVDANCLQMLHFCD